MQVDKRIPFQASVWAFCGSNVNIKVKLERPHELLSSLNYCRVQIETRVIQRQTSHKAAYSSVLLFLLSREKKMMNPDSHNLIQDPNFQEEIGKGCFFFFHLCNLHRRFSHLFTQLLILCFQKVLFQYLQQVCFEPHGREYFFRVLRGTVLSKMVALSCLQQGGGKHKTTFMFFLTRIWDRYFCCLDIMFV